MSGAAKEARAVYVTGVAGAAFLAGNLPLANGLNSIMGLVFLLALLHGAVLLMIARRRQGRSILFAFSELAIIGVFGFGLIVGVMWFFLAYMPSPTSALLRLRLGIPTSTIVAQ